MPNCISCGLPIPDGQGSSCSMCYGDPHYGRDGYALRMLEEQAMNEAMEAEEQYQEMLEDRA